MYETVDLLNKGRYFWETLAQTWPMPFQMSGTDYAVLGREDGDLSLVVCKSERPDDLERTFVQVFEKNSKSPAFEATLTSTLNFVSASLRESLLDEIGAVDALALFGPLISGEWMQKTLGEDLEGEEEHG